MSNVAVMRPRGEPQEGLPNTSVFPFWLHLLVPTLLMYHLCTQLCGIRAGFTKTKIAAVKKSGQTQGLVFSKCHRNPFEGDTSEPQLSFSVILRLWR